jgi:hypothetical protein
MFGAGLVECEMGVEVRVSLPPQRNATLNPFKFARNLYLCYFSKPVGDRTLYKLLRKTPVQSVVEIGLERIDRTLRMLELATAAAQAEPLRYAGIDLFEGRDPAQPGVTLKQAHKVLKPFGAKLQLIPGDVFSALARSANQLTRSDLVIISAGQDPEALAKAWFYLPRMLHDDSRVLIEEGSDENRQFRLLTRLEIEQLASQAARRMRKAA